MKQDRSKTSSSHRICDGDSRASAENTVVQGVRENLAGDRPAQNTTNSTDSATDRSAIRSASRARAVARVVALVGQKGGTGKTTTAISLAQDWSDLGLRVLLVDVDPQGSCLTWSDVAAENSAPAPAVIALGVALRQQLAPHLPAYDVVVIDCPPAHTERQRAALMVADLALLPTGPDPTEIWAATTSADLIREAQAIRPTLHALVVVTRRDRRTSMGAAAERAAAQLGLPVADTSLARRITYPEALAVGRGPTSYAPSSDAAREVRRLVREVEGILLASPATAGEGPT